MGSRARLHSRLQRALGQIHVRFHFKTGLATTLTFHVLRLTYMDTWRYLRHLKMVFYLSFLLFLFFFFFFYSFYGMHYILRHKRATSRAGTGDHPWSNPNQVRLSRRPVGAEVASTSN